MNKYSQIVYNSTKKRIILQQEKIVKMFDKIANKYDVVNRVVSFGIDKNWRKESVNECFKFIDKKEIIILDVACGTGDMIEIWKKHTHNIYGIDPSKEMLKVAKNRFPDISFYQNYAVDLPFEDNFADILSISFGLRNVIEVEKAIKEFYRVLKKDGILLILEFTKKDKNSVFRTTIDFYSNKILPKIASFISDKEAYEYLPNSIEQFYTKEELIQLLNRNNFKILNTKSFNFSQVSLIIAKKI